MKKIIELKTGDIPPMEIKQWLGENGFLEVNSFSDGVYYGHLIKDIQLIIEVIEK